LEEKLRDLEIEKAEMTSSIEASKRTLHTQKNSTQAEAFRLKGNPPFKEKGPWCISSLGIHVQMNSPLWNNFIFGILPMSMPISSNSSTHLDSTFIFLALISSL